MTRQYDHARTRSPAASATGLVDTLQEGSNQRKVLHGPAQPVASRLVRPGANAPTGLELSGLVPRPANLADELGPSAAHTAPVKNDGEATGLPAHAVAAGPGAPRIEIDASRIELVKDGDAEVHERLIARSTQVRDQVKTERGYYDEFVRVMYAEQAAGRLVLRAAEMQQLARVDAQLTDVFVEEQELAKTEDFALGRQTMHLARIMAEVGTAAMPLLEAHADQILPYIGDVNALNYLVNHRLVALSKAYRLERAELDRSEDEHEPGWNPGDALDAEIQETLGKENRARKLAATETSMEAKILSQLGGALLAELEAKSHNHRSRLRSAVLTHAIDQRQREKSAAKRKEEITRWFGDFFRISVVDDVLDMELDQGAAGSVTLGDLEARLDAVLNAGRPGYIVRAVRAAVMANPDLVLLRHHRLFHPTRETVAPTQEMLVRTLDPEDPMQALVPPRERLLQAGLEADHDLKLNDLKVSIARSVRHAISVEYERSKRWYNPTPALTLAKMRLLEQVEDRIVLASTPEAVRAIVRDAQREHDALWHDHRAANGGTTARSLALWLEAVDRFLA